MSPMTAISIIQYSQLCVTCQATTIEGHRQCSYCHEWQPEINPPRLALHASVSQPARKDKLGRRIGHPSWDICLENRRVAHVYHNRHTWVYWFADNPYRLFSQDGDETDAFAAIADHIDHHPAVLKFWLTGGSGLQYLESSYGAVAALVPVPLLKRDGWRVRMLITNRTRDFANARDGVEWAKKLALKYIDSPIKQKGTSS